MLSQCLSSEGPFLSTKFYSVYVCYTNTTVYVKVLSAVPSNRGRSWNALPVDTGALLYIMKAHVRFPSYNKYWPENISTELKNVP
jgi:hypothetical protein